MSAQVRLDVCVPRADGIDVIMVLFCIGITTWWGQNRGDPRLLGPSKHEFRRKPLVAKWQSQEALFRWDKAPLILLVLSLLQCVHLGAYTLSSETRGACHLPGGGGRLEAGQFCVKNLKESLKPEHQVSLMNR